MEISIPISVILEELIPILVAFVEMSGLILFEISVSISEILLAFISV